MPSERTELAALLLVLFSSDVHTRAAAKRAISLRSPSQLRYLLDTAHELDQALTPLISCAEQRRQVKDNLLSLIRESLAEAELASTSHSADRPAEGTGS